MDEIDLWRKNQPELLRQEIAPVLEKIKVVRNVGRVRIETSQENPSFDELTVVYGDNGAGKTTLAAVLDSLREDSPEIIQRRRGLPGERVPRVHVDFGGQEYIFDGEAWDGRPGHGALEVFCTEFISRNVYCGDRVDTTQRRNLCEFVLGRKAVEDLARLTELDASGRTALKDKNDAEDKLLLLAKSTTDVDEFVGLESVTNLDELIDAARAELDEAKRGDEIQRRALPSAVELTLPDAAAVRASISRSFDDVSASAVARVQEHFRDHLDSHGEEWLAYGAEKCQNSEKCPFCAQDLAASTLVSEIRQYFSDEYRVFTEDLTGELDQYKRTIGAERFADLRSTIERQLSLAAAWSAQHAIDPEWATLQLDAAAERWTHAAIALSAVLKSKRMNPLEALPSSSVDLPANGFDAVRTNIAPFLKELRDCASAATKHKQTLKSTSISDLQKALDRLLDCKTRHEDLTKGLVAARASAIRARSDCDAEKRKTKSAIDKHATRVVEKYQEGINAYLLRLGCDMRIEEAATKYPGGKASVSYQLRASGHVVPLGASDVAPCFETVLSESEKTAVALSFFLARLIDRPLKGRTIVFDDPVNSFGRSRRLQTKNIIRELRKRGAQVVVLTHDLRLAAAIWGDRYMRELGSATALQIQKTGNSSRLVPWGIEEATRDEYFVRYLKISEFIEKGGDHRQVAARIRPYLEDRIRYLAPDRQFPASFALGDMMGAIRESGDGERLSLLKPQLDRLGDINEAALPAVHGKETDLAAAELDAEAVRLFAKMALEVC